MLSFEERKKIFFDKNNELKKLYFLKKNVTINAMEERINKMWERWKKRIFLCLALCFLVRLGFCIYLYEYGYESEKSYTKKIVDVLEVREVTEERGIYLVAYEKRKFLLYDYQNRTTYQVGDRLSVNGKIVIPELLHNPYEFNYKRYLNANGIIGRINTSYISKIGEKRNFIMNIKEYIYKIIDENLDKEEASFFKSMFLGMTIYEEDHIEKIFTKSGLSHLLAMSGTHLIYLQKVLDIFLSKLSTRKKESIKLVVFFLFSLLVSFQIGLVRSMMMYSLGKIKKISRYEKWILSAICLLIYHPYMMFHISFIFSFLSILGIYEFFPFVKSKLENVYLRKSKRKIPFFIHYFMTQISLSLSVYIILLPFFLYYFQKLNILGILSTALLSPLFSILLFLGFLCLFSLFIPPIATILFPVVSGVLKVGIILVSKVAEWEWSIEVIKPSFILVILYYLFLFYWWNYKFLYRFFHYQLVRKLKKIANIVLTIVFLFVVLFTFYSTFLEEYVIFFNVGQGNMAFFHKGGKNIVVDLGSTSYHLAGSILLNFLKAKKISKIDMIIVTHMHEDHIGSVEDILKEIPVDKICIPSFEEEGKEEKQVFLKMLKAYSVAVLEMKEEEKITLGKYEILFFTPSEKYVVQAKDILNANSMSFLLSYQQEHYLFLGDATKETEYYVLSNLTQEEKNYLKHLKAVQIGHHGSNTSTSKAFIEKLNPCIAIISAKKEKYGHPDEETITLLKKYHFDIKITEEMGAIQIH